MLLKRADAADVLDKGVLRRSLQSLTSIDTFSRPEETTTQHAADMQPSDGSRHQSERKTPCNSLLLQQNFAVKSKSEGRQNQMRVGQSSKMEELNKVCC